jgi:hypothetical protein
MKEYYRKLIDIVNIQLRPTLSSSNSIVVPEEPDSVDLVIKHK